MYRLFHCFMLQSQQPFHIHLLCFMDKGDNSPSASLWLIIILIYIYYNMIYHYHQSVIERYVCPSSSSSSEEVKDREEQNINATPDDSLLLPLHPLRRSPAGLAYRSLG